MLSLRPSPERPHWPVFQPAPRLGIIVIVSALIFGQTYWADTTFVYGFIIAYRWLNAFAKIGVYAVAMQCCSRLISASQFTFYMTIGALGFMVGATLIGPVKENLSWEWTFLSFVRMLLLAVIVLWLINIDRQVKQMAALEEEAESQLLLMD